MASFWATLVVFMACFCSQANSKPSHQLHAKFSTISASPAYLPSSSPSSPSPVASSSPALSPDISPLFPTPAGMAPSPTESSLPTITSSPSPPNPDDFLAPAPDQFAVSPSGIMPVSSSLSLASTGPLNFVAFVGFTAFCLMQLACM
ncbi:hypothetical protein Dsin_025284 [Dipteronia sinensis]|uniref:Classical arabinogalactan protein 26-like n=1 Tax=Dipteronia sinensis TaxID=43782 RepID=A0AAD9ZVT8_9ROSI|nr:hypothetical protein Dsin_025284 [Dipteronia sinensis]